MKLPKVAANVAKDEIATERLVSNPKKAIAIATITPAPPIPAIIRPTFVKAVAAIPAYSSGNTGNTGL